MKWSTKVINLIKSIGWQVVIPAPRDENIVKIDGDIEYTIEIKRKSKKRLIGLIHKGTQKNEVDRYKRIRTILSS